MSVRFAKINRPQLAHAYPRKRLFAILDEAAIRPLTWISANAGAGKTVLMASYLEARQLPDLWYRMDARDTDPSTFFYYLREAALHAGLPKAEALPLLTSEYVGTETVFAQNFFMQLFADISHPYVLVFDNYQDLPETSSLHAILSAALRQISPEIRIFILSRTVAPATMARWQANQSMTVINAPTLQLDLAETTGMLTSQADACINDELVGIVYRETGGWAAGVILLIEHISQYGAQGWNAGGQSREAMFHYFATELYQNASADMRSFLGRTAMVPQFNTDMAFKLTGMHHVDTLVRELLHKNYFIYEQYGDNLTYQYHPLFRQFLRETLRRDEDQQDYQALLREAGEVLRETEQVEDAADLFIEACDWQVLTDIILKEADKFYGQGRAKQIERWIMSMPKDIRLHEPWLQYWIAVCRTGFDLYAAREAFESACRGFQANGDTIGRCLAAAGVVETYIYEWGDFKPLDRWIDELDGLLASHAETLNSLESARVTVALFTAYMYRRPDHAKLPDLSLQVHGIIERLPNDLLRLTAGSHLLLYYAWWQGDITRGGALVKLLKPLTQSKQISPLLQITWLAIEANYSWMAAQTTHCIEIAEQALHIAEKTGVHVWDFMLLAAAGWGALTSDKLEQAHGYLERMAATVQPGRLLDLCHFRYQLFMEASHRDDIEAMHEHSSAALQLARDAGVPWAEGIMLAAYARAQAARGEREVAEQSLRQVEQLAYRLGSDTVIHSELLARVEWGLPHYDEMATLQQLMSVSRRRSLVNFSWWRSTTMSKIFAQALAHDIETDFVFDMIKRRGLVPDPAMEDKDAWPWPLRLFTLGQFSLVRHNEVVTFSGKAQKKPMDVLKVMIAFGGNDVSEVHIMEALWPDSDGDMAKQNLKSTVYRLRKLLKIEALIWSEGKLSFDPRYCWVDVWSLERFLNRTLTALPTECVSLEQVLQRVERSYPGPFLQGEEAAFVINMRERLRSKLLRLLFLVAERFIEQDRYEQALLTYRKGLEIEALAENFYQGMMECQRKLGRTAEALTTYENYRRVVEHSLGVAPSPEIAALAASLRQLKN